MHVPSLLKAEPWQGQSNVFSMGFHWTRQPCKNPMPPQGLDEHMDVQGTDKHMSVTPQYKTAQGSTGSAGVAPLYNK